MLTILGTIAVAWAFVEARQAVLWVFVALFLAIVLSTPVTWLQEHGMKRSTAALLVMLVVFLVFGLLAYLLISPFVGAVRDLVEDLPQIVERIRDERAFDGPEALAARIEQDVREARKILENRQI